MVLVNWRGLKDMFEAINRIFQETEEHFLSIDAGEYEYSNHSLSLIISMYKEDSGQIMKESRRWKIWCEDVREHSIKFLSSFACLQVLDDHPVLFKYHKPLFLIQGPIQIYEDDLFYGQLFTQLQKYLDTYFARDFINDFMPNDVATSKDFVFLCNGSQEIVNIYSKVLESRSLKITTTPSSRFFSDSGKERLLLLGSSYIVAEQFSITEII